MGRYIHDVLGVDAGQLKLPSPQLNCLEMSVTKKHSHNPLVLALLKLLALLFKTIFLLLRKIVVTLTYPVASWIVKNG